MVKPVMKNTGATPTNSHLHDHASHILLGRSLLTERKAMWAGRKQFTQNVRSARRACACVWLRLCIGLRVCASERCCCECVGHVWACKCVWVSNIPIHQSQLRAAQCPRRKMNRARRYSSRCCGCHHFLLIHPEWLWVGRPHLANSQHGHRNLAHEVRMLTCHAGWCRPDDKTDHARCVHLEKNHFSRNTRTKRGNNEESSPRRKRSTSFI